MAPRPRLVLFDAVETLFSLEAVRERLVEVGAPPDALESWLARLLRDAMGLTAAGGYAPFREIAVGALAPELWRRDIAVTPPTVEHVLGGFEQLEVHHDVVPALDALAEHPIPASVLTNGTAETTEATLRRAGIRDRFEHVVTVHEVERWKPHPEPYRHAIERAGVPAESAAMVAVHGWDIAGARRAGLVTGWCNRLEGHLSESLGPADVVGEDLGAVVRGMLALPEGDASGG